MIILLYSVIVNLTHLLVKIPTKLLHIGLFKNFDEANFLSDLSCVPWEILENFDDNDDFVSVWNSLFLENNYMEGSWSATIK